MSRKTSSSRPVAAERFSVLSRVRTALTGVAMVALGSFLLVAAISHHPLDASLNVASDGPVRNLAGARGAVASDLLLQTLGWSGLALALILLGWGLILLWTGPRRRPGSVVGFRVLSAMIGIAGFAAALSALPLPVNWPFAAGLGGLVGDTLVLSAAHGLASLNVPASLFIAGGTGLVIAIAGTVFCFGLTARDLSAATEAAEVGWVTLRVWTDQVVGRIPRPWRRDAAELAAQPVAEGRAETAPAFLKSRPERPARAPRPRREPPAPSERVTPTVTAKKKPKPSDREAREAQGALPFAQAEGFELPRLDLLNPAQPRSEMAEPDALAQNAELLESVLSDFGVKGEITEVRPGPVVTLYELEPAPGVKTSRVINLADDIARSMAAVACRVAVVPGRNAIGIELPNQTRETVYLRALLSSVGFEKAKAELPLTLGETIGGEPFFADLARMPHLLIAGTTGSGKSVGINAMILSLLYRHSPSDCRFIMIDPKMLELSVYDGIPHLLSPVVTDPKKAVAALKWTVREMESRYLKMSKVGVRNMDGFNDKAAKARAADETLERTVQTGFDRESGEPIYETEIIEPDHMPYIVVVIDEMADLMMVAGKEIEGAVQRLAQMARAAGIHLIMATQRPSVDVITGTIKANFPTRISYSVTSKIDSRTILGEQGAEQLLGMGDLLYMAGGGRIRRLHGPFVSDTEVEEVANFLKSQGTPEYLDAVTEDLDDDGGELFGSEGGSGDDLFDQAVAVVARDRKASTSYIQRRLQIGYNRAASLIERMEDEGMIGPADHAGKREIFLPEREDV
ncbi:DNA translocase FtsK [Marinicauda pacifica]|uniref:DNA translocase FtsK n=1 Tax=Marinicauda pacifica TaxID=1133559 RepID=A0A4S2HB00_9PROT|nr:DNA translocase FtsK 4TM domain-containing protein [Marinicauda pacifica]TGY93115.1 cell division protein FtsK [Marinicauda pacifica]GGE42981.1 DNA translocase FtsK [Marinicauda pacifica]